MAYINGTQTVTNGTTAISGLTANMQTFFDRALVENFKPYLLHYQFGLKKKVGKNTGKTISFARTDKIDADGVPIGEGVTSESLIMGITEMTATLQKYAKHFNYSSTLENTDPYKLVNEYLESVAELGAVDIDIAIRDVISANNNFLRPQNKLRNALVGGTDVMTVDLMRKAVKALEIQNVKKFNDGGREYYAAIIHPSIKHDIQADPKWIDVGKYAANSRLLTGEVGEFYGVRCVMTTNSKVFTGEGASGVDVYDTLVMGKDCYGVVDILGDSDYGKTKGRQKVRVTHHRHVRFIKIFSKPLKYGIKK